MLVAEGLHTSATCSYNYIWSIHRFDQSFQLGHRVPYFNSDGNSNSPERTAHEAKRAREQGIHLFAIGVGASVDRGELGDIASFPSANNVHQVGDYASLESIKEMLAIETCLGMLPCFFVVVVMV